MRILAGVLFVPLVAAVLGESTGIAAESCEGLSSLALPNTTITLAQIVPAGAFSRPQIGPSISEQAFSSPVAFCRVAATLKPSSDSDIRIEVWLPLSGWNGKFQAVGNGGWAGMLNYPWMSAALGRGYATSSTDTGHVGNSGIFALGHPEKLIDFGYRAVHEMTLKAKAIIEAFYGNAPRFSYWNGCSNGGRQGLKEAQRYPTDYDGIIAGAPGASWTHTVTQSLWVAHATLKDRASYIAREKYAVIHEAVLQACDGLDGIKDGVLEDPMRCHFDPKVLQCSGNETSTCLTAPQVEAARKIYGPAKNPRTGVEILPGLEPGSELEWAALAAGPTPYSSPIDHFKYVVFKNPNWDYKTLDFDRDVTLADRVDGGTLNATNSDLKAFVSHGGKLLMYHGWTDQLLPPRNSVTYYSSVVKALGGMKKGTDSVRLFMAPGMNHCRGGAGPDTFDPMSAIEQWVENGKPPDLMVASHSTNNKVDRTRPLCSYPQVSHYRGVGSTDDAANFVCKAP